MVRPLSLADSLARDAARLGFSRQFGETIFGTAVPKRLQIEAVCGSNHRIKAADMDMDCDGNVVKNHKLPNLSITSSSIVTASSRLVGRQRPTDFWNPCAPFSVNAKKFIDPHLT